MKKEELYHHGVKGMKWGVRKDRTGSSGGSKKTSRKKKTSSSRRDFGSAVASGKKAVAKAVKKASATAKKKVEENKKKKAEEEIKNIEEKKKAVLSSRSAKELYDNADLFTYPELQAAYNRLQLERNISSLSPKEVNKGKQYVDNAIVMGQKVNSLAKEGITMYNNVAKLYNAFSANGKQNPLPIINNGDGEKKKAKISIDGLASKVKNKTKDKNADDSDTKDTKDKKTSDTSGKKDPDPEVWEGEVVGNGPSSKGNASTKSKPSDYYDPIDGEGSWVNNTPISNVPAVVVSRGEAYVAGLLEEYK